MEKLNNERIKEILLIVKEQEPYGIDREELLKHCTIDELNELTTKYFEGFSLSMENYVT